MIQKTRKQAVVIVQVLAESLSAESVFGVVTVFLSICARALERDWKLASTSDKCNTVEVAVMASVASTAMIEADCAEWLGFGQVIQYTGKEY